MAPKINPKSDPTIDSKWVINWPRYGSEKEYKKYPNPNIALMVAPKLGPKIDSHNNSEMDIDMDPNNCP